MTITPLAVYFLYFIFSHPDSELCAPESRSNDCFSEYQPVCALYTGDSCHSQTGFCYKTLNNACIACSGDTIIGYVPGECQQPTIPQVCKKIQRGLNCEDEHDDQLVCAYSKPTRFKGHNALIARTQSNSCEACSSEQVVFHIPGECQQFSSFGGCIDRRTEECYDDQAGPLCVYYRGEDCTGELCRRTELNSCNVCQDSTVLFYVEGACPGFQPLSEDEIVDNGPEPQYIIPELEAVIQEDGTTVYEEVDEPKEEPGECFPELEAVLLEDGTTIFVPRDEPKEVTQEYEPVVKFDGPVDYDKVETLTEKVIEMNPEDSKIASILKEDKLLISEQLESLQPDQPSEGSDCYVEPQDYIPELEAVVQVDGSVIYEELKNPDVECVVEEQTFIPELEAIVQADGTVVYEEFKPSEEGGDCYVEPQDYIPELEAVVQPDGSIVYEEVQPSEESTFTDNEEALLVPSEEEEKIGALPFIIQVIDSRLLINEPSN